ncbi:MAG TPA: uroporphyrinogen-III C-methyltransferase, partial [Thermaerobacter sp.]
VDDPPHCSFILPAVHRQGDLVVAIGTGGKSPALATRLRDRLARELGPEYATWIALLGSMRPAVAARIPDPDRRRALWYRMVDSEGLALVRRGDVAGARRLLEALLDAAAGQAGDPSPAPAQPTRHPARPATHGGAHPAADRSGEPRVPAPPPAPAMGLGPAAANGHPGPSRAALPAPEASPRGSAQGSRHREGPGTVYLVGAGPGDPELLTLRAARILAEADCVLHDRLVSPAVLARVRPGAELIPVGKAPRHAGGAGAASSQEAIVDLLADRARRHRVVVRLKGGDPMVFGRGGEELAELRRRGIPVQVVPGVTSAVAAPGLAGIPLTLRGVASSFTVASGHCQAGSSQDWARLAAADTLVVLMGVANRHATARALIEAGRPAAEPCAFVEWASWPAQRVIRATLGAVAAGRVQVEAPAVWIIGPVAAWADEPAATGPPPGTAGATAGRTPPLAAAGAAGTAPGTRTPTGGPRA